MLPQLHLVEGLVYQSLLPEERSPGLNIVSSSEGSEQVVHFLLVELEKTQYLFILFSASPQFLPGLVSLLELMEAATKGLHHS
jgi:hypothetical protein